MDAGERFRASLKKLVASSTKSEVCRQVDLSRPLLDAYLSGKTVPSLTQAERIATGLGMTLEEMLSGGVRAGKTITPRQALQVLARLVREKA
jgi:transcriptional regulator with XRE-family HTH domain